MPRASRRIRCRPAACAARTAPTAQDSSRTRWRVLLREVHASGHRSRWVVIAVLRERSGEQTDAGERIEHVVLDLHVADRIAGRDDRAVASRGEAELAGLGRVEAL